MRLFLRMLPAGVGEEELYRFVQRSLRSPWSRMFGRGGRLKSVNILKITDIETGSVEYHGVADIEPAKSAMMAARRLQRSNLRGRELEVRPYHYRTQKRDRRGQKPFQGELNIHNRRVSDRRRAQLRKERVPHTGEPTSGRAVRVPLLDESQVVKELGN